MKEINSFQLARKNLLHKPANAAISIMLLGIAIGLIGFVSIINSKLESRLNRDLAGVQLVVGAKGSPLQLVLSALFHADAPTGNIALADYEKVAANPLVEKAIPLAYGDNFHGYRILGVDSAFYPFYDIKLSSGTFPQAIGDVVLSEVLADELQLEINEHFYGDHGLHETGEEGHGMYKVVGIFKPTKKVADKLLITPLETLWEVHHVGDKKEITAGLFTFKNAMGLLQLPAMINKQTSLQAAIPSIEVNRVLQFLGAGTDLFKAIGLFVVLAAIFSIVVTQTRNVVDRAREIALLRAMGLSRRFIVNTILFEALMLSVLAVLLGLLISYTSMWVGAVLLQVPISGGVSDIVLLFLVLFLACWFIASLASVYPLYKVFRNSIVKLLVSR